MVVHRLLDVSFEINFALVAAPAITETTQLIQGALHKSFFLIVGAFFVDFVKYEELLNVMAVRADCL